jgi:glutamate N-acetyltransferase/amino-acid N-acetyltransferase
VIAAGHQEVQRQPRPRPRRQRRPARTSRRRACSPATRSRPRPSCGPSRSSRPARCARSSSTPAAPTPARAPRASRSRTPPPSGSAELLGCGAVEVAVCSTGLIGAQLPRDTVLAGVEKAHGALTTGEDAGTAAATAIMTTDTVAKQADASSEAGWRVGGMTKGAGMIAPSMATMLSVLTTDAVLDAPELDAALRAAVRVQLRPARRRRLDVHQRHRAGAGLGRVRGRGPTRRCSPPRVTRRVPRPRPSRCRPTPRASRSGSRCGSPAPRARTRRSSSPGRSPATPWSRPRCSGPTPNWGRVAAAAGYADAADRPRAPRRHRSTGCRCASRRGRRGRTAHVGRPVRRRTCSIAVALGLGGGADGHTAEIRTTDLSHAYVEENSAYSS